MNFSHIYSIRKSLTEFHHLFSNHDFDVVGALVSRYTFEDHFISMVRNIMVTTNQNA